MNFEVCVIKYTARIRGNRIELYTKKFFSHLNPNPTRKTGPDGSTSLDRQNLWNSLKPTVNRQQRKFFKTVSCPTTAVSFPNPNPQS